MATDQGSTAVGSTLLFENQRVRVWAMKVGPGESCPPHKHLHDHVIIYGMRSSMRGYEEGVEQPTVQDVDEDFVLYRSVGKKGLPPHRLANAGPNPSTHYIVEILGPSISDETQPYEHNGRGRFVRPGEKA